VNRGKGRKDGGRERKKRKGMKEKRWREGQEEMEVKEGMFNCCALPDIRSWLRDWLHLLNHVKCLNEKCGFVVRTFCHCRCTEVFF